MTEIISRLFHWGPLSVLGMIKLITWCMMHVLSMYWPPQHSIGGAVNFAIFLFLAGFTLYSFLQSLIEGPGFVPKGWVPVRAEDKKYLQYCTVCNGYKAPRSHHCRKCGRCILKMDHHCPWINCCVGHSNHGFFTMFLISAVIGCLQATVILSVSVYHSLSLHRYIRWGGGPLVYLSITPLLLTLLAIGMSVGVVLAVGGLFVLQMRGILRNQTTIEEWILQKAEARRKEQGLPPFVFPYNLGCKQNFHVFVNSRDWDGLKWPVKDGCGEFDLTIEQQAQKADKRLRTRQYSCVKEYSGSWCPLWHYLRAALRPPCSDEPRLRLEVGDKIRATRQKRSWIFGEKIISNAGDGARGPRGWFPIHSVTPLDELMRSKQE